MQLAPQRLQSDFSIGLWVKLDDLNRQNPILGSASDGYYRLTFEPYIWGTTTYRGRLQLRNSNPNYNLAAETAITAGSWHHVAIVRSGVLVTLYVDGVAVGQGETADRVELNAFGRHEGNYFKGQLDDLQLYDRALSAAKVQTIKNGGTP